jgi:hypothetical protein
MKILCLFQHAVSQARLHGAEAFEQDTDPHAVAFYQRLGCRVIGQSLSEWGRLILRMRYELPPETNGRICPAPQLTTSVGSIAARLHHTQQPGGRVPVADGHALVDRQSDDAGQAALGRFADESRKI